MIENILAWTICSLFNVHIMLHLGWPGSALLPAEKWMEGAMVTMSHSDFKCLFGKGPLETCFPLLLLGMGTGNDLLHIDSSHVPLKFS